MSFLQRDTSAVMIEIYAVHWFRDIHVGSVQAIVGNLIQPDSQRRHRQEIELGMQFVALQVWRPSGRPQGILNIGVALLDNTMRSMPLYWQMGSSAVGYRHLMGEEDPFQNAGVNPVSSTNKSNNYQQLLNGLLKPELRRTKSDSSSVLESDLKPKGSSIVIGGSMVKDPETGKANNKIASRGSSMRKTRQRGETWVENTTGLDTGAPKKLGGSIIWTDSELGPSPSEVAAAVARNLQYNRMEETGSSVADEWSLDESIEGLQSKLGRWRTDCRHCTTEGSFRVTRRVGFRR
ncbi:Auxin-responsive protein IAA13, putative isoform 1 [Hibiscus syriacus]|uniref:Auxin-responsive protein IAA13, putative isoform 1 n=1 Tax=Hibiscus syriacus TaxID=106335 RepID=A0A6A2XUZ6_HIBSY|nr:Auxin-responsive protein IAA13, putative isoform 1 [Hibiscus syriacus]